MLLSCPDGTHTQIHLQECGNHRHHPTIRPAPPSNEIYAHEDAAVCKRRGARAPRARAIVHPRTSGELDARCDLDYYRYDGMFAIRLHDDDALAPHSFF